MGKLHDKAFFYPLYTQGREEAHTYNSTATARFDNARHNWGLQSGKETIDLHISAVNASRII